MHALWNQIAGSRREAGLGATGLALSLLLWSPSSAAFEHRHALGTGYHFSHVASDQERGFSFHSFPVTYVGRYGGDWAAGLRLSYFVPVHAQQASVGINPREQYDSTLGLDALLGPNYRLSLVPGWMLDVTVGVHANYLQLLSDRFVEWSSATMGLGSQVGIRHRIDTDIGGAVPELGVHGDINVDFIDFSRGGDLKVGVQTQWIATVGWSWGAGRP